MDVEIQLGSPRYHCDRFGICKIDDYNTATFTKKEGKALAKINLKKSKGNNYLVVAFQTESITNTTFNKHFSNGIFTISTDSMPSIHCNLGNNETLSLKAGNYPISITMYYQQVVIPCFIVEKSKIQHDCILCIAENTS